MTGFAARGGWWVVGQFGIGAGILAALAAAPAPAEAPGVLLGAGVVLVAAGGLLAGTALLRLGPALTPYPEPRRDGRLVEGGPYRLVRHPIYGGIGLAALGIATAAANVIAGILAVGLIGYFAAKAAREEARLEVRYPAYAAYRDRVRRRLIPWVL